MDVFKLLGKILLLIMVFIILIVPVNAEILVDIFEGVNVYSDVNNSWDYSTRYEINTIKEVESDTNYTLNWIYHAVGSLYLSHYYEDDKPTQMYIDFNSNSGLKTVTMKTNRTVSSSFIEGCGFTLMDGGNIAGYGSFFMWADVDDKLIYLFDFDYIDSFIDSHTFDIIYNDDSIFNELGLYKIGTLGSGSGMHIGNIIPSGNDVYLKNYHESKYQHQSGGGIFFMSSCIDEMATINTIINSYESENNIYYHYNTDSLIGYVKVDNIKSSYKIGLTHDLYNTSTEDDNEYYIYDTSYRSTDQEHNNNRGLGVKIDLYTDSTINYPEHTFILDYGGGSYMNKGYYVSVPEPDEPPDYATSELTEFDKMPYNERDNAYIMWNITDYVDLHGQETFTLQTITSGDLHGDNYVSYYGMHDSFNNPRSTGYISHHIYSLMNESINGSISVSISYEYYDPIYNKITISGSYITTDILSLNYTYVPPEPIDPPSNPDIPINDTLPEIPDSPPPPSGLNQTLNTSWSGEYYNLVNGMVSGLGSPLYNFTSWSLIPVTVLSDSINDYNVIMNESFTSASSDMIVMSESINIITEGFHPKIRNLITYYLVWLILLLVLRKK